MDFSKIKTNDWLMIGGALGMVIFGLFLDWISVDTGGFGSVSGANAFDFFFTGTVPWLLLVAVGVIVVLRTQDKIGESQPWDLILLAATVLAVILLLIRIIFNPGVSDFADRGIGMYLSFISAGVAAAGAVMAFLAAGGSIGDLTDVDKLKGAFNKSDSAGPTGTTDSTGSTGGDASTTD